MRGMNSNQTQKQINSYADQKYKYGFETFIESERPKKGLSEDTIKFISKIKNFEKNLKIDPLLKNWSQMEISISSSPDAHT